MELLTANSGVAFNPEIVKQHGLIRAKYHTWRDFRNGLVTLAQRDKLTVLFQTGVNTSTSYFRIKAAEVDAGLWQITYTNDMENFYRTEEQTDDGTN